MSESETEIKTAHCQRCEMPLRVMAKPGWKATMLRRAKTTEGLCVHCAVHDWLRNTYPVNVQLARSGPGVLLFPHVRKLFGELMQAGNADAKLDEINWNLIVENWELPFPNKMKTTGINPVTEEELQRYATEEQKPFVSSKSGLSDDLTIRSFDELNSLSPGLGDDLKQSLDKALDDSGDDDDEPPRQRTLFEGSALNPSVKRTERTKPMTTEAKAKAQAESGEQNAEPDVQALTPADRRQLDHYRRILESQKNVDRLEGIAEDAKAKASSTKKAWENEVKRHGALTRENLDQMTLPIMDGDSSNKPQPAEAEAWRDVTLQEAGVSGMKLTALAECDPPVNTLGQFSDLTAQGDQWWKPIQNLGPKGAEEIQDTLAKFWDAHPEYCRGADVAVDARRVPARIKLKVGLGKPGTKEGTEHDVTVVGADYGTGGIFNHVVISHKGDDHQLDPEDYEVLAWRTEGDGVRVRGTIRKSRQ